MPIKRLTIIAIFEAVGQHVRTVKFGKKVHGADLGLPHQAKFYKNYLWGIIFLAKVYQKLLISAFLGAVNPHFKSDTG